MTAILGFLSSFLSKLIPQLITMLGDKETINVTKTQSYRKVKGLNPKSLDDGELLAQLRNSRSKHG